MVKLEFKSLLSYVKEFLVGWGCQLTRNVVVKFFYWKGDIINCCCYRAVKLLEHGMKVL